ncbi:MULTISPECIES: FAD/NAD(P)-binding protein [Methylomonas]|uniref:FAD/NAD(P)-binding protein n=1 Tax=Methylomonas TaxID=416 RepID=UPI0016800A42|nr:FAD/NAD(P)-binding protein [Methylomonas rhizoryzae]
MVQRPVPVIGIVGGGFSGTMLAVQLIRQAREPMRIKLIERKPRQMFRGVAYSTDNPCHYLNVPAGKISAFAEQPEHFLEWARSRTRTGRKPGTYSALEADSFVARRLYGDYLTDIVQVSAAQNSGKAGLETIAGNVVAVDLGNGTITLHLAEGDKLQVDRLVLAVGNFPPAVPVEANAVDPAAIVANPWNDADQLSWRGIDSCLIVGAGLTMVDWVLSLQQTGFAGRIHVLSRRGLRPTSHADCQSLPYWLEPAPASLGVWLRRFRQLLNADGPYRNNWRGLIDALRPHSAMLWQSLSDVEQKRFIRHLRPYWDNHRHRLAPQSFAALQDMERNGGLQFHKGRIESIVEHAGRLCVRIRSRAQPDGYSLSVDRIMNCTGSECDYRNLQEPLITQLVEKGLGVVDNLGFGLAVAADGALIDRQGRQSELVYTLGPPKKGSLWETTAVPEIRLQAQQLATVLLASFK